MVQTKCSIFNARLGPVDIRPKSRVACGLTPDGTFSSIFPQKSIPNSQGRQLNTECQDERPPYSHGNWKPTGCRMPPSRRREYRIPIGPHTIGGPKYDTKKHGTNPALATIHQTADWPGTMDC